MLTPNELEAIPEQLVKIFRQLELDVMNDIIERIAVNKDISRTADWEISRLYELGVSKRAIKKRIKDALKLSTREINLIYKNVIWQDYARYEPIYRTKGKPWIPYEKNRQLQQLIAGVKEQTNGELKNITQSLGFALKNPDGTRTFRPLSKVYQQTLDKSAFGMLSGVYDYNTMIKQAVQELTDSGLRTVVYETDDGKTIRTHINRVEVAARRALMTGFNQVVAKITEENAEQLGADHFEVTYHRGARPTHQPWQGRVYTREELVTVCGYGDVTGLKGANCYHDFHPFFEGLSKRLYTDGELDRMNAEENTPKQYGDKEYTVYEALQRQRRMETSMRRKREKIGLLEKGEANEDDILAEKAKYHALSDEYAEFSKAMGLPQQRERISVDGRKGVDETPMAQKPKAEKPKPEQPKPIATNDSEIPQFKKAKNIKEAESVASEYSENGSVTIDPKMKLEIVNGFNEAADRVYQRYGRKLRIKEIAPVKSSDLRYEQGAYNPKSGTVSLANSSIEVYRKKAEKLFTSGWNASKDTYGTFYHEIGHAVWEDLPREAKNQISAIYNREKHKAYLKWMEMGGSSSGVSQAEVFQKSLSRYAHTSTEEFFSEAFSQIMSGRARPVSREVNAILNEKYMLAKSVVFKP